MSLLATKIENAIITTDGISFVGSVVIRGEQIAEIAHGHNATCSTPIDRVVNAEGLRLLPGIIDSHVHFREPGYTHKGNFSTESHAAAAGGVTSIIDMPNTLPQTTTQQALREKLRLAAEHSIINFGAFWGATNENAATIDTLVTDAVAGIKIFMGASTGGMMLNDKHALQKVFDKAKVPIVAHCESQRIIESESTNMRQKYGNNIPIQFHSLIRNRKACLESTQEAIRLAKKSGACLHIAHVSTADELDLIANSPDFITAEACISYLMFDETDYTQLGSRIKCNPAIKSPHDREVLLKGLSNEQIYTIATDHAPHLLKEKEGDALRAASGIPMVQFSLPAMLQLEQEGLLNIEQLVTLMCHHPAKLFGIENRGHIREGYQADLTLVAPNRPFEVTKDIIQSLCRWSPLEGRIFKQQVVQTYVNGALVYDHGKFPLPESRGHALRYRH